MFSFWVWVPSHSIIFSSFVYLPTNNFSLLLTSTPLCICATFSISLHQLMGIQVVSISQLLWARSRDGVQFSWRMSWGNAAGSYGDLIAAFLRVLHTHVQDNSASLQSHQQRIKSTVGSSFPASSPVFIFNCLLDLTYSDLVKIIKVGLICLPWFLRISTLFEIFFIIVIISINNSN